MEAWETPSVALHKPPSGREGDRESGGRSARELPLRQGYMGILPPSHVRSTPPSGMEAWATVRSSPKRHRAIEKGAIYVAEIQER